MRERIWYQRKILGLLQSMNVNIPRCLLCESDLNNKLISVNISTGMNEVGGEGMNGINATITIHNRVVGVGSGSGLWSLMSSALSVHQINHSQIKIQIYLYLQIKIWLNQEMDL